MRSAASWCAIFGVLAIAGCSISGRSLTTNPRPTIGVDTHPFVVQTHNHGKSWARTGIGLACKSPGCDGIAVGPDGNVWATDSLTDQVFQVTMSGIVTQFKMPKKFFPSHITAGVDGHLYVTGSNTSYVVQMTTFGAKHKLLIPSGDRTFSDGIVAGSSAVWFLEGAHIAKISADGSIKEIAYPSGSTTNNGAGITVGPDQQIWFVDQEAQTIGHVDQTTGRIGELATALFAACYPYDILSASGFLWVGCGSSMPELAKVTTGMSVAYYSIPWRVGQTPQSMTVGPNGDPWMVSPVADMLSDFDPLTNSMTTYLPTGSITVGSAIALAPDGNLWMTGDEEMDVFLHNVLTVSPKSVALDGPGLTQVLAVKERGTTVWTAGSSNPAVATVDSGQTNSQFVVTAVASGSCLVTISDAVGNSFDVAIEVD